MGSDTAEPFDSKMPLPATTPSTPPKLNLTSRERLRSGAAAPPDEVAKKKPSIERYLGNDYEKFSYGMDSITSNDPSSFIETLSGRSTANSPPSKSNEGEGRRHQFSSTGTTTASLAVIKTVPMPRFPIRVFHGDPPPFSRERQRRTIRWRYDWFQNLSPHCIQDPDIHSIQKIARPFVKSIDPGTQILSVDLLARGSFNQAYNITTENVATRSRKEYVFRVSLPVWPYYKIESDVATTEFVRLTTSIPVPVIYAFDSNPNNALGFEWMLMEKVKGMPLGDVWDTMDFDAKQSLTRIIAGWMAELSQFKFSKIGSIFMRYCDSQMEFYIGPLIHERLHEGDRLLCDIDRGPFQSIQHLYDAILDTSDRYFNDLKDHGRHAREESEPTELHVYKDPSQPDSEDAILARADADDQNNEAQNGFLENTLSILPEELQSYKALLPDLCALLPPSKPLNTMLTHPDLLQANIFVDSVGAPIALIDWERARLQPLALVDVLPKYLDCDGESDAFYAPSKTTLTLKEYLAHVFNPDRLASVKTRDELAYKELMGRLQRTRLRAVYREELKRLKSPLCSAFNRDPKSFEQQLMRRIYWPENTRNTHPTFWAADYLGESYFDNAEWQTDN